MKDENEKSFKAVEPKKSIFSKSEPKAEKPTALIAKKGLKVSKPKETWSVKAGQDVSGFSSDKLAILKLNGVI